jgi:mannose-6-phosphate isomerase-like protein (cupin superfamily)
MAISINLNAKLNCFSDHWEPKIVASMNDYHIKLAKVQGEFVWHDHPNTDELFLVIKGRLVIQMRDGDVRLEEGEMFVVPKGVEHNPMADKECQILLMEPKGTMNTGSVGGTMAAPPDVWI